MVLPKNCFFIFFRIMATNSHTLILTKLKILVLIILPFILYSSNIRGERILKTRDPNTPQAIGFYNLFSFVEKKKAKKKKNI